jgi:hypothetical protein
MEAPVGATLIAGAIGLTIHRGADALTALSATTEQARQIAGVLAA